MSVLISHSSPTLRVLTPDTSPAGPGKPKKLPNQPFNDQGELYATGGGMAHGWSGLFIDRHGGMRLSIGNVKYNDGKNFVRLWNHSKDRTVVMEIPVKPVWLTANGRSEMLVDVYLKPQVVVSLGFESGDTLALQSRTEDHPTQPPTITLAPVFLEAQVLPQLKR